MATGPRTARWTAFDSMTAAAKGGSSTEAGSERATICSNKVLQSAWRTSAVHSALTNLAGDCGGRMTHPEAAAMPYQSPAMYLTVKLLARSALGFSAVR